MTGIVPGATGARCPDSIDVEAGARVECEVDIGPDTIAVEVVQGEDAGQVAVNYDARLLEAAGIAAQLSERFEADLGVPSRVVCGEHAVLVVPAGGSVVCEVTDERGVVRTFDVVVEADGTLVPTLR